MHTEGCLLCADAWTGPPGVYAPHGRTLSSFLSHTHRCYSRGCTRGSVVVYEYIKKVAMAQWKLRRRAAWGALMAGRRLILCCRRDTAVSHRRGTGGRWSRALGSGQFPKGLCGTESPVCALLQPGFHSASAGAHCLAGGGDGLAPVWSQALPEANSWAEKNSLLRAAPQRAGLLYSPGPAHPRT